MIKIKRRKKQNPSHSGGTSRSMPTYRPKTMTQDDMEEGLRELFASQRQSNTPQKRPQQQRPKPLSQPIRRTEDYPSPRRGKPQQSMYRQPEPPVEEYEEEYEEDPYWSGEEWEEWAIALYETYPKLRNYLPEWFLEAVEE